MLSVWQVIQGIVHYKLLDNNRTITINHCCNQLHHLKSALDRNVPPSSTERESIFHYDNAHFHTAQLTKDLFKNLGWEKLLHLLYFPDIAPFDYPLFKELLRHLGGLSLTREEIESELLSYFT